MPLFPLPQSIVHRAPQEGWLSLLHFTSFHTSHSAFFRFTNEIKQLRSYRAMYLTLTGWLSVIAVSNKSVPSSWPYVFCPETFFVSVTKYSRKNRKKDSFGSFGFLLNDCTTTLGTVLCQHIMSHL